MDHRVWPLLSLLVAVCSGNPILFGEITSPKYPQGYPNDAYQSWNISVPKGFGIKLYFLHLDIEPSQDCEYDFVQVLIKDEVKGKFCGRRIDGSSPTSPLYEQYYPTNNLRLEFTSDFSNEERYTGFSLYYIAEDLDECEESSETYCSHFCNNHIGGYFCSCPPGYFLQADNHTCGVNCSGNLYTDLRGQIHSPGFPSFYPENSLCDYKVRLIPGYQVVITFQAKDYDIETGRDGKCTYDILTIQAGEHTHGPFCGRSPPARIETGSNQVDILFQTDSGGENKGWLINYSEDAIPCDHRIFERSQLSPAKDKYVFKDTITVTCIEGYEFVIRKRNVPSIQSYCRGDGTWSVTEPKCQLVDCGAPSEISNGRPTFSKTTFRSTATYSCVSEYYQIVLPASGDGTFRCSSKGLWVDKNGNQELPKCTPVCGTFNSAASSGGRIFGGKRATLGKLPWLIAFVSPNRGAGALISERWVMTAAHVVQESDQPEMFGGLINLPTRTDANLLKAKKVIIHPKWVIEPLDKRVNFDNDIALIQLCSKVQLGPNISPVCLSSGTSPGFDDSGYIAGWGRTEKRHVSGHLMFTAIPLQKMEKCQEIVTEKKYTFSSNMLCAGDGAGNDSCEGDSGGPLTFLDHNNNEKMYVAGIVSWGVECGKYGVYTKVENYLDWIKETIDKVESEEGEGTGSDCR
uniref:Complement C1s n=1 Tax=Leptobrachium leishanense TaxID=445787 RepID=A0A8C5PPF0_9ANUR